MEEPELFETKGSSGKTYSFRKMKLSEKIKFNRIALSRMRNNFVKIDAEKEAVIFQAAMTNELKYVIFENTLVKVEGMNNGDTINEGNIENYVVAEDYEKLTMFLDDLNYPSAKLKKNSKSSSGKEEEQATTK